MPDPDVQQQLPAAPSPDQQGDTAAAGPQPSAPAATAQPQAPAGTPAAAPTATPQQLSTGDRVKHGLGEIFQTLAGGKKAEWNQTPNGPVKTYRDLEPGEMARGILAAAITGLASGYDPANRGKGPAMASAFSAGFKGNQERVDKQAAGAQKEAQEQFTNKNASDELLMKKAKFAQEQQESILNMQKTHQIMNEAAQRSNEEGIKFTQDQQDHLKKQDNEYYSYKTAGGKEIEDPKNPGQDLVLHTMEEGNRYIADHKELLLAPGEFDTRPFVRPGIGGTVILKTPRSVEEKRDVHFAQRDNKGNIIYKDGQMVPTGKHNLDGSVIQPGTYSGAEARSLAKDDLTYDEGRSTIQERLANAEEKKAKAMKDISVLAANKQYDAAGSDPTGIDISTGQPKLGFKNREVLKAFDLQTVKEGESNLRDIRKEIENAVPNSPSDKELRASYAKTQGEVDAANSRITDLKQDVPLPDALTKSLLKEFKNDPKAASEFFEKELAKGSYKLSLPRQNLIDDVRENLSNAAKAAQQKKEAPAVAAPKNAVEAFGQEQKTKAESKLAEDLSEPAKVWQGSAAPQQIPQGRGMGMNPDFTEAEAYIKANPKLSPDERAAVRNDFDRKNGRIPLPTDPQVAASVQALAGKDRNTIQQSIATSPAPEDHKAQMYKYFYLTPPAK